MLSTFLPDAEALRIFAALVWGGLWLLFGSFASVIITRLRSGKAGIIGGRSACRSCGHVLSWYDLFPIFSYLSTLWKCRYCRVPIGGLYIALEVLCALLFAGITWKYTSTLELDAFSTESALRLIIMLAVGWVWLVVSIYDILYQEIPDQIVVPTILLLLAVGALSSGVLPPFSHMLVAAGGVYLFFALQISIPASIWYLRRWHLHEAAGVWGDILSFPAMMMIDYMRNVAGKPSLLPAETESAEQPPVWMGGGDLRLAILLGLTLGQFVLVAIPAAYIIGSVVGIIALTRKVRIIPFGPFLAIGWLIAISGGGHAIMRYIIG